MKKPLNIKRLNYKCNAKIYKFMVNKDTLSENLGCLIPPEQISCIHFLFHIIQTGIITVCKDCVCGFLEFIQVIYDFTAEKCASIFEGWLINDNGGAFGFDSFHDSLDTALAEVVGIAFHGETVNADDTLFFLIGGIIILIIIIIVSGEF